MKYIKQFAIIMTVTCIGEVLKYIIPLAIPASIYGLCLMLILLMTGIVKVESVKETGNFLIEIMPLMFIPSAVGLLVSWKLLSGMLVPAIVITVISTFLVMIVAGRVTQAMIKIGGKDESASNEFNDDRSRN